MKFLLSIILWAMMPMLTPQGLQIGVVNINNKTIRIMKMNLNNPAFLQSAGNVGKAKEYITMVYSAADQSAIISSDGDLLVSTIKNGQTITAKYSNLDNSTIRFDADANSVITLSGKVTTLSAGFGPYLFDNLVEVNLRNAGSLTYLKCNGSQLTSLDVSNNTALTYLNCNDNPLTSLDVSANTALTSLYCANNQLTSLDVSNNTALTALECNGNQLTSLDVSNNTALTALECNDNPLTSLDVSNNTALTDLDCNDNQLTSLDVSNNTALTDLNCANNQLTSLDVSNNTALTYLNCNDNPLTSLDVSANTALTSLYCANNEDITTIKAVAVYDGMASAIASLITDATSTTGTVTLRNGDEFNSTISDAATTKGWSVEYVDA